jgi:hypothetical protein
MNNMNDIFFKCIWFFVLAVLSGQHTIAKPKIGDQVSIGQTGKYYLQSDSKQDRIKVELNFYPKPEKIPVLSIGSWNILKNIKLNINGKKINVPMPCTMRLDVDNVRVDKFENNWRILLDGGDGIESYMYSITYTDTELVECQYLRRDVSLWPSRDLNRGSRMSKITN